MAVTIKDIAQIAGVSHSTVSRSLNGSNLVAECTKSRIIEIAHDLGFEFNANARSLSTRRTGTIGIIYPESFEDFDVNLYYSSLHNLIRKSLEREELDLIVAFPKNKFHRYSSNIKRLVKSNKVDGLIVVNPSLDEEDINALNLMKELGIPFVFLHHFPTGSLQNENVVCTDHFRGGYLATEHLLKKGHRNIACISTAEKWEEFVNRTSGYKKALADYQVPFKDEFLLYGDRSFKSSYQAIMNCKDRLHRITALFAETDLMALGAMEGLKKLGIRIPQDIAVVGYDDIELATYFTPFLTTVHQPRERIAILTCEMLINLIKNNNCQKEQLIIEPTVVVRESCGGNI
ncbi:laci bacterial regulatory protein hth signature [Lucifera butyrica]|uniref:Laci bacterial regulatory protein hth signature n=1 Tax=Lucifera butyrica TaxID=1351585 RepID=A0A498R8K2_9FIRM|nr:laci bacterial regulatory protein hth signature [Lucifera butyrica]